jgi:tRNA threonylcarbamoyl adenosine modification protein YeaZ
MESEVKPPTAPGPRPLVLAADTTTPLLSLLILGGDAPLAEIVSVQVETHSRRFFDHLAQLFRLARVEVDQLDLLAVATGPGSFTGVRVAMASLQGLAYPARKPVYGVDSLDLQALRVGSSLPLLVLLEAGRGEVYAGFRHLTSSGTLIHPASDRFGAPAQILPPLLREVWPLEPHSPRRLGLVGTAARRCLPELAALAPLYDTHCVETPVPDLTLEAWQLLPLAEGHLTPLARYAARLHHDHQAPRCTPCYIRPSDAELHWSSQRE